MTRNKQIATKKAVLFEVMPMLVQAGIVRPKAQNIEIDQYYALSDFMSTAGVTNFDKIFKVVEGEPGFLAGDNPFESEEELNGVSDVSSTSNDAAMGPVE